MNRTVAPMLLAAYGLGATIAAAQTVTVDTARDIVDFGGAQTIDDLPGPDGRVSFREALYATDNTPGPQTIAFAVPRDEWWHTFIDSAWLEQPAITPDDGSLVVAGTLDGGPGFVGAYGPSDGKLRWNVAFPGGFYPEERPVPADQARVSADSSTAYVSTIALSRSPGEPRAVLYAIDLADGCAADFNDDGAVNTLDVLAFLNAWSAGC